MSKGPGFRDYPDYTVKTSPLRKHLKVFHDGEIIADTRDAILLEEEGHEPVYYIPISDLKNIDIEPSQTDYTCPFKGKAEFYHLRHGDKFIRDAAWAYNQPYDSVQEIKEHVAFYPEKIERIQLTAN